VDKMEKTISQMEDRIRNLEIRGIWTLFPKQIWFETTFVGDTDFSWSIFQPVF
jgi:hypothetical protein